MDWIKILKTIFSKKNVSILLVLGFLQWTNCRAPPPWKEKKFLSPPVQIPVYTHISPYFIFISVVGDYINTMKTNFLFKPFLLTRFFSNYKLKNIHEEKLFLNTYRIINLTFRVYKKMYLQV